MVRLPAGQLFKPVQNVIKAACDAYFSSISPAGFALWGWIPDFVQKPSRHELFFWFSRSALNDSQHGLADNPLGVRCHFFYLQFLFLLAL
jgi:hypothetical protein